MDFWPFGVSYPSHSRAYPRQQPSFYDPFGPSFGPSRGFGPSHPSYYRDVPAPSLDDYPSNGLFPSYDYPLRELATPRSRKQRSQKSSPKKKPNSSVCPACDGCRLHHGGNDPSRDEKPHRNSPIPSAHKTENVCNQAEDLKKANGESTTNDIIDTAIVSGEEKAVEAVQSMNNGGTDGKMEDAATAPEDEDMVEESTPSINAEEVKKRLEAIKSIETQVESLRNCIDEFSGVCGSKEQLYLTETLMSYLLQLDKILAEGNDDIRLARKQVVVKIGKYIEDVETKAVEPSSNTSMEQMESSSNSKMEECVKDQSDNDKAVEQLPTTMEQMESSSCTTTELSVDDTEGDKDSTSDNVMQTESTDDLTSSSEPNTSMDGTVVN